MAEYSKVPSAAKLKPLPFKAHVDDQKLEQFKQLIKLSPIGPAVWENTNAPAREFGMQRDWLINAKKYWETDFNWRKHEDYFNSFPQFTVPVTDDGVEINVHFLALFSEKPDAIPIAFYHGWPGSFCEFLDMLGLLKKRYSPADLPYHVIVPSMPGYAYSSGPPVNVDYTTDKASSLLDKLMVGLGFENGYLAQGGDLGSFVSRWQASNSPACKGCHLNMCMVPEPPKDAEITDFEKQYLPRGQAFRKRGMAYAQEHGTRTSTIGFALSASPLALLAWIGEKFLEWTDEDPPVEKILESVSLYWLTDTFPRCIYPYRGIVAGPRPLAYLEKPLGYSFFPKELFPAPKSWAASTGNLVAFSQHQSGGHFAAMEKPEELLNDVEQWIPKAWK